MRNYVLYYRTEKMIEVMLILILILLCFDVYQRHKETIRKYWRKIRRKTGEFYIDKKWVGDKIIEEFNNKK